MLEHVNATGDVQQRTTHSDDHVVDVTVEKSETRMYSVSLRAALSIIIAVNGEGRAIVCGWEENTAVCTSHCGPLLPLTVQSQCNNHK
jgi:hypothetical protein